MRTGVGLLLFATAALATPEEEIAKIFAEPASIPGKLDFAAYSKLLAERGYPKTRATVDDLRLGIARWFGSMLSAPCRVLRIRVSEDGASAIAIVNHGRDWLVRWFLVRGKERWWYADFEPIDSGLRFTDWDHVPRWLNDALNTDDEEEAVKLLLPAPEGKRPATIEAVRLARLAYCLWIVDRDKEALKCCEEAAALSDAPVIELRRSYAAMTLRQYDVAAKAASSYLDAVGDDPDGCYQLGRALYRLDRRPDAVAAHLRGLKTEPYSSENILGLYRALPDDGKAAAAEHFLKLEPLPKWFAYLAWHLADEEEWAALEALLAAYRKGHEDDPATTKYDAVLAAGRGRHAEAAPILLAVLPKCGEDRGYFASKYLQSMEELKKPLEGYEQLSPQDRDLAWSYLACLLSYRKDAALLDALLAKRRDRPDASLAIWEIELRFLRKEYAEVDALFKKHAEDIGGSEDKYRSGPADRQVRSLLRLGKAADAVSPARAHDDAVLLFAVYASLGRTEEAAAAVESGVEDGRRFAAFEEDEDAGPLLLGDAYAALRAKHGGKK